MTYFSDGICSVRFNSFFKMHVRKTFDNYVIPHW